MTTRDKILDAAYALFYAGGFARTGVDAIAAAAGVTKRTLYYHFESKDALLAAVLAAQHALALERIRSWIDGAAAGGADGFARRLFGSLAEWASQPRWRGSGFTRAAMEYADSPGHPARRAARDHKRRVEALLAETLAGHHVARPDVRARQLALLLEGCLSAILIHGDTAYADAAAEAAEQLLANDPTAADRA